MTGKARVIKLDSGGNVTWQRVLASPGGGSNSFLALQPTGDGDYVLGGPPGTFDSGNGAAVVKLDARGNLRWQKAYGGGAAFDAATAVQPTADGGIVVAGTTGSFGAGQEDIWLFKLSASGDILWQRTFGGTAEERANSVRASSDGDFILAGHTQSFGAGRADIWLLKVGPSGAITGCVVMGASNAAVAEGNATIVDIPTLLLPRSATPANPNANFARSTGLSDRQCYFDAPQPVASTIPTLSDWALSLLASLLVFLGAIVLWRRQPKGAKA